MPQSSLMAWLNQPSAVKEPSAATTSSVDDIREKDTDTPQLPTPPRDDNPPPHGGDEHPPQETSVPSVAFPIRPLPQNVEFRPCSKDDLTNFKRLTGLLLPIPYPEKFYKETVEDPLTNNITLLAVWHDDPAMKGKQQGQLVGAIRCRLLAHSLDSSSQTLKDQSPMLYLSTLALLSPYRSHGIATHLLHTLVRRAIDDYGITSVGAHVWEANTEGLEWYRKRGFREMARRTGYYRRLDPQTAVIMQRNISVMDFMHRQPRG